MEQHGTASWRLKPGVVPLNSDRVRLVEGNPVLHTVSERLEEYLGLSRKIIAAFCAMDCLLWVDDTSIFIHRGH
jgi:hypothetical protein